MQEGDTEQGRIDFFKGKNWNNWSHAKIVQTKDQEFVLVGGHDTWPTLIAHPYDVMRSCHMIDLSHATVAEKACMVTGRLKHGIALICNYVYAIAGWNSAAAGSDNAIKSCERYDVNTDKWSPLPEFDQWGFSVALVVT
jgi:hypothetical protein